MVFGFARFASARSDLCGALLLEVHAHRREGIAGHACAQQGLHMCKNWLPLIVAQVERWVQLNKTFLIVERPCVVIEGPGCCHYAVGCCRLRFFKFAGELASCFCFGWLCFACLLRFALPKGSVTRKQISKVLGGTQVARTGTPFLCQDGRFALL